LDLRNNGGGYYFEATQVASQFLPAGQVIVNERNAEGQVTSQKSTGEGLLRDLPMIVLINQGTASGGEILAGALQENGRARLVGATTFGTGTVLSMFNLSDGSLIRLGVTNWLTPKMNLIKNQGVKPDVAIKQKPSIQMVNADTLTESDQDKSFVTDDRQFNSALLLMRLMLLPGKS
jgi:carboxyl-terminal processing protease